MSKEEDLEKFDLEYSLFEVDEVKSKEEVNGFFEVLIDDIEEYDDSFHSQIKDNKIRKRKALFSNYFAFFIGYEFPEYYDRDNEVISMEVDLCKIIKKLVSKTHGSINDNNFLEVFKLLNFIRDKFYDYIRYLERVRDGVELELSGVSAHFPKPFELEVLKEFFDKEIKRISLNNSIEKKKVM